LTSPFAVPLRRVALCDANSRDNDGPV
jgi:hypothetical protein